MWHVWPGQHWPFLRDQEVRFIEELAAAGKKSSKYDRDDATALLNALRCGTSFEDLMRFAPGAKPGRMIAVYNLLEKNRALTVEAWLAIEQDPTIVNLRKHSAAASRLLPLAIHRSLAASEIMSKDGTTFSLAASSAEIHQITVFAHGLESALVNLKPQDPEGVEIGCRLYNPHEPGVYGNPFYLPDRVASLSPVRVREFLGETPEKK
jgi:hypothetical protein